MDWILLWRWSDQIKFSYCGIQHFCVGYWSILWIVHLLIIIRNCLSNFLWRQEIVDSTIFLEFLLFLCCFYAYSYQYDICNARPLKILLHYCTLFELLRLDRYSCRKLWILWKWILLNLWTSSQSYNSNIRRYDIHHFCVRQGRMSNNEIVFVLIEDKNFCLTSSYITIEYTQNLWIFSSLKNISKRKYKEIILMARRHRVFQLMHSWTTINNNSKHWRKEKQ